MAKLMHSAHDSSPSIKTPNIKYDVFISHRGKDVHKTVDSLIYYNLCNRGLSVFLDNKLMPYGVPIALTLRSVIRNASVHVAIFSKTYAESAWCLNELCWMLESKAPIIPIFYGVRPSDLSMDDENGLYSKAMEKHLVGPETLQKWRDAVRKVSSYSGVEFEGDEGLVLEDVAAFVIQHIPVLSRVAATRVIGIGFYLGLLVLLIKLFEKTMK